MVKEVYTNATELVSGSYAITISSSEFVINSCELVARSHAFAVNSREAIKSSDELGMISCELVVGSHESVISLHELVMVSYELATGSYATRASALNQTSNFANSELLLINSGTISFILRTILMLFWVLNKPISSFTSSAIRSWLFSLTRAIIILG